MIERQRLIFEKACYGYNVYVHSADLKKLSYNTSLPAQDGRAWIEGVEARMCESFFPRIAEKLKVDDSIEVELSIRTIGAALPWEDWTWEEKG